MPILNEPHFLTEVDIRRAEEHYSARYVCETALKLGSSWRDYPSLVFYTEVAHPQGSNYFALSIRDGELWISDALPSIADGFTGIRADSGDIIYSRCRHDFRTSADGSVSIDGGRDYLRVMANDNIKSRLVHLRVIDGVLTESELPEE